MENMHSLLDRCIFVLAISIHAFFFKVYLCRFNDYI